MQVAKWGRDQASRLLSTVIDALGMRRRGRLNRRRERALERIRALRRSLPPGWKFDRDEANAR
jgi:antitoxin MazE